MEAGYYLSRFKIFLKKVSFYRSQFVTNDEFDVLKTYVDDGLLVFSNFFFTSIKYLEQNLTLSFRNNQQEIISQIDISNTNYFMSIDN